MKTFHALDLVSVCTTLALTVALAPATSSAQSPADAYAKAIAGAQQAIEQSRNDEGAGYSPQRRRSRAGSSSTISRPALHAALG